MVIECSSIMNIIIVQKFALWLFFVLITSADSNSASNSSATTTQKVPAAHVNNASTNVTSGKSINSTDEDAFFKYKDHACKVIFNTTNCTCEMLDKILPGLNHMECKTGPQTKKKYASEFVYTCIKVNAKLIYNTAKLCISIFGIIGNLLVLVVRVQNWKKSLHYQLISGLAAADLCFSFVHFVETIPNMWLCHWVYGLGLCKIMKSFLMLSSSIDLGFILIIAIERYIGIVHPFTGGASANKIYLMIGINIMLSLSMSIPEMVVHRLDENGICREHWSDYQNGSLVYGWITNLVFFAIPIVVTAILYYHSLKTLKSTLFRQEMLLSLDEFSRKKLVNENTRILRIICSILLAFLLLVGPNHVIWFMVDNMEKGTFSNRTINYMFLASSLAYAVHTTVNPVIYSIIDRKFRKNVLFLIRFRKRRKTYNTMVTGTNNSPIHMKKIESPKTMLDTCE